MVSSLYSSATSSSSSGDEGWYSIPASFASSSSSSSSSSSGDEDWHSLSDVTSVVSCTCLSSIHHSYWFFASLLQSVDNNGTWSPVQVDRRSRDRKESVRDQLVRTLPLHTDHERLRLLCAPFGATSYCCTTCDRLLLPHDSPAGFCTKTRLYPVSAADFKCLPCRFLASTVPEVFEHFDTPGHRENVRRSVRLCSVMCDPCGTMMYGRMEEMALHTQTTHRVRTEPGGSNVELSAGQRTGHRWSAVMCRVLVHYRSHVIVGVAHSPLRHACTDCGRFDRVMWHADPPTERPTCPTCWDVMCRYYCATCNVAFTCRDPKEYGTHLYSFEHLFIWNDRWNHIVPRSP